MHSLIGVDLDRQGNGRAQQHSVRRRVGYHQVVAGEAKLSPESHRERQDAPAS